MRFLHTADWHLGRTLHGEPLLAHQRVFLDWLVEESVARGVDAVLVAGDVYDRAVPTTDAVAVLDNALARLAGAGVRVVLISGNHDSAIRLGFARSLAAHAGVHLRTDLTALTDPVVIDGVGVYGLPYLLPDAVMTDLDAERSHTSVLAAAVALIKTDAAARALDRVVVVAHAFVTGAAASDSERDIRVGGIGDAPAWVFDGIAYTALGHLHGAQQVAPNVRYAGSPMPFSFSERHHHKSVAVVEIDDRGAVTLELVPTPVARPMAEIRGRLAELLSAPDGPPADAWIKAVLTDPCRPSVPMERLRERWPNTLVLEFDAEVEHASLGAQLEKSSPRRDPVEVCVDFVQWVDSTYPDAHQRDALTAAVEAALDVERIA
jgi:exonuclease SbcD